MMFWLFLIYNYCYGTLSLSFQVETAESTDEIEDETDKVNLSIASSLPFLSGLFFELFVSTRISKDGPVHHAIENISTICQLIL